jgi:hypothetical protein
MSVARRLAVAFAVVGLGVLAYAVPASATESQAGEGCITNPTPDQLIGTLEPRHGIAHVRAKPGLAICADVLLSVYTVPDTWEGAEFNRSAIPQHLYGKTTVGHVAGTAKTALTVAVPTCGAVQVDLYTPPEITDVNDLSGHDGHLIQGYIWRWWADGKHLDCDAGSTSPVPAPTESTTSPAPTESTTSPAPTESTTAPAESTTGPAPTESTTAPVPTETTTAPVPAATTPLAAIIPAGGTPGPIVAVPAAPAPPAAPVLASTGSNATLPLIGFGGALLVAGIALSLLGRRKTI